MGVVWGHLPSPRPGPGPGAKAASAPRPHTGTARLLQPGGTRSSGVGVGVGVGGGPDGTCQPMRVAQEPDRRPCPSRVRGPWSNRAATRGAPAGSGSPGSCRCTRAFTDDLEAGGSPGSLPPGTWTPSTHVLTTPGVDSRARSSSRAALEGRRPGLSGTPAVGPGLCTRPLRADGPAGPTGSTRVSAVPRARPVPGRAAGPGPRRAPASCAVRRVRGRGAADAPRPVPALAASGRNRPAPRAGSRPSVGHQQPAEQAVGGAHRPALKRSRPAGQP